MAQTAQTPIGTLTIPGAIARATVQNNSSAVAANGVVAIVAEADGGPRFSAETSLGENSFGPNSLPAVRAKYGSGPLVDAYIAVTRASADPEITGSVNRVILVKPNAPTAATGTLGVVGGGTYATVTALQGGKAGNLVNTTVTQAQAEVLPTTGAFIFAPPQASTVSSYRANGGAALTVTSGAAQLPSAYVTAVDALSGVAATGGVSRAVITSVAGNISAVQDSGFQAHYTISTAWANTPVVGDILYIPTGSPFAAANEGTFVVTAATSTRIDAYKLLDAAGTGAQLTAPTTEGPFAVAANTDIQAFSPVVVTLEAGNPLAGTGKALEIAESGAAHFAVNAYKFASATASPPAAAATFVSTSTTPALLVSGAEYRVKTTVARQSDSVSDAVTVGGDVVLRVGYAGTTATMTITAAGVLTTTVTGGAGANLSLSLGDFATVSDLATYIGTQAGYTAVAGNAALGQVSPSTLDPGTYGVCGTNATQPGRVKDDGADYLAAVNAGLTLASVAPVSPATKLVGLPAVSTLAFLAGGARGGTSDADIGAALDALLKVKTNFVVAFFDRDASAYITAGTTDPSSTFTIAAIGANLATHIRTASDPKRRKARQGFTGFRGSFSAAKSFAAGIASGDVAVAFQDVKKALGASVVQHGPRMLAAMAAGMQAAGFVTPITRKQIDCSGVVQAAADFDDQDDDQVTDAINNGLLVARRNDDDGGVVEWVVDQTTYTRDANFVFNSIQAGYLRNLALESYRVAFDRAFTGQPVSRANASAGLTIMEHTGDELLAAGILSASDGVPKGYDRLVVKVAVPTMLASGRIFLNSEILFEVIDLDVWPVTQTATG